MRFCPRCGSRYEHERFCPEDGAATQPLPEAGPPRDALLGTLVDQRYRIDAQIGEGGMGVVYKATHVSLNKTVALKILRGEMAKDPEVTQRFMQEAQAASGIGHENIIDIHDFGKLPDGTAYFVMECLSGHPLNEMIKRGGSIPTGDAVQILRQVASALSAAHDRGIIHRDLKPDNVIVLTRGELTNFVKVLDFGIAKVGATKNKLTRTGMVFGTPHYMSPEQAAGQSVDARTDIYALGVMMYEMFTGRVPFEADTFMGVLTKHMFEKPAPMFGEQAERQLGALEQITLRALEKKPENRYPSMNALIEDLDRVLGGGRPRQVAGTRPSLELADALEPRSKSEMHLERQRAQDDAGGSDASANFSSPSLPTSPRWRWFAAAALAMVVVLLVFLFTRKDSVATPIAVVPALAAKETPAPPPAPGAELPVGREPEMIVLRSAPLGAEIFDGAQRVGLTPSELPRPSGQRALELRLDGYQVASVSLGANSPSTLDVALKKQQRSVVKKPPTPAPPAAKPKRRRIGSEVVDPWAE